VKLTFPNKREHCFRPLNFEAENVKSMVSSLQSCGRQCFAKDCTAPQAAKTFSCTARKEKPEAVSQANSDARQYSLTLFFSTLVSLVKISIMIGDRHEAKQPY
jgi:hypothetical protein